jgi:hypothetical protein
MHAHAHGVGARLEHRDDALGSDAAAQAIDGGRDRRGVVRKIIVDTDAVDLAVQLPWNACSASSACGTSTPTWRAAAIAASAFSTL